MKSVFVTGTDTEVGKTLVSSALVLYWARQGYKSAGFKPVAAGAEWKNGRLQNEDAEALMQTSNLDLPYEMINPCVLELATAPHIAAEKTNTPIDLSQIDKAYDTLLEQSEKLVVEGAGGWQVPFSSELSSAEWVASKKLPVILVVNIKLGCLNHAQLSVRDIAAYQLPLLGWVANQPNNTAFADEMITTLKSSIQAPCLGHIPELTQPDAESALSYLDFSLL